MAELAVRNVEHDSIFDFIPISIAWQEDKLCVRIDKFLDEPRTSHAVHFNFLASDPFHELDFVSWQPGSGMRSLLRCFTARIKSLLVLRPSRLAMVSAVLLSKQALHCRFSFT